MISNNKFHAERIGIFRLSNGADAVIHRNDQARAAFRNFFQRPLIQPVAFRFSGRDIIFLLGTPHAADGIQSLGRRNLVTIIITVQCYFPANAHHRYHTDRPCQHTGAVNSVL